MRAVVIDTNCILQMISRQSPYFAVWKAFDEGKYLLCVSNEIINEYQEVIAQLTNPFVAENVIEFILNNPFCLRFDPQYRFNLIQQDTDHTSLKMKINESMQLNATPKPDNATRKSVNWISSDEAIVSVNSSGVVTANAAGSASIYCMAVDNSGVVVTCTVDVEGNPTIVKNNSQEKGIVDIFYNLSGQRLTAPCQGINIVNGKKVVIK